MQPVSQFFQHNMVLVFFVYGLAWTVMGLAITLENRKQTGGALASSLPFLAAFGFLHAAVEWGDMLFLIPSEVSAISGIPALRPIKIVLLGVSTACLAVFGARLIIGTMGKPRWLKSVPYLLFFLWLTTPFVVPHLLITGDVSLPAANTDCLQCHLSVPAGNTNPHPSDWVPWTSSAEVWARYLLYLPGLALTAAGLLMQGRVFQRMKLLQIARDCRFAAAAFIMNMFFAGLIVAPASYFPASVFNYNWFVSLVGIPPQVFRTLMALIIAFFVVRILRVFELENAKQLDQVRQESFEAQLHAAHEVSRMKSEFVSNVSHELRTPLNAIIGFSELLLDETYGKLNPKQMRHVSNVHTSGKHLLQLVNDILDTSKLEAGKLQINLLALPLDDQITTVVAAGRNIGRSKSIVVDAQIPPDMPRVLADPTRLNQILYNLVSNAVKFSPQGGKVTIAVKQSRDMAQVSVADTGIGISADDMEKLFVPFQQLGPVGAEQYQGTGLGLSLTKQLIELHGGKIWVDSKPRRGATFYFTLPLEQPENKECEPDGQRADTGCRG